MDFESTKIHVNFLSRFCANKTEKQNLAEMKIDRAK